MHYKTISYIVATNGTLYEEWRRGRSVHRPGPEGDSVIAFRWICYGILPEWSKGADLRSARRLSAWVQTPQVPLVPHFLLIRIWCQWVLMWVQNPFITMCVASFTKSVAKCHMPPTLLCIECAHCARPQIDSSSFVCDMDSSVLHECWWMVFGSWIGSSG